VSQADEDQPLPAAEEAALLATLEAALRPAELDPALNERLIETALEDPLAPPSEGELAESERLRQALEGGEAHEDAELLSALRSAAEPHVDDAAVERALLAGEGGRGVEGSRGRGRGNVIYAVFGGASAVLAAAAMLMLFVGTSQKSAVPAAAVAAEYAKPRSTAPLFSDRFETRDTTARVDLIASARARDLRGNRYAAWGVP
jgi:hypothetical protein